MSDYIETATIISPLQRLRIGGDGAVVVNTSSSPKATIAPSPCLVYIDVSFVSGSNSAAAIADTAAAVLADPLRYDDVLTFRNYYTSSISILQLSSASSKYVPILENRKLMTNAYCEEGSQSWCVIHFTEFNSNFVRGKPIRIIMNQPGSMWKVFEIRAVKVLRRTIDPHSSHQLQHQLVRSGGGSGKDFTSKGGDRDVLSSVGDLKGSFCEMIQQDYRVFVDAVKEQTLSKDFYSTASSSAAANAGTSAESSQRTGNSSKAGNNTLKKKDSSKETTKKKVN
eukprot:gene36075-46894_t